MSAPQPTAGSSIKTIISATTSTAVLLKKRNGNKIAQRISKKATSYIPSRTHSTTQSSPLSMMNRQVYINNNMTTTAQTATATAYINPPLSHPLPPTIPQYRGHNKALAKHSSFNNSMMAQQTTRPLHNNTSNNTRSFSTANTSTTNAFSQTKPSPKTTSYASLFGNVILPTGILASGSALYLNISNDAGQTLFSKALDLDGQNSFSVMSPSLLQPSQLQQYGAGGDDDDDMVLVVGRDTNALVSSKFTASLDAAGLVSRTLHPDTDSIVSSTDAEYALSQSQSATATGSGSGGDYRSYSSAAQHQNRYEPLTPSQRRATTTSQSSQSSSATVTDLSGEENVPFDALNPIIIGAPPSEFHHPLDIEHSPVYKFLFGLRRFCTIVWTFMPFIRHYVWTHQLHYPTPKDRADMLNNLSKCIEQSGCAFIKFGQWLSMRPDIFPQDVIEVLSRLRDGAPAHEFQETREIILKEFGMDINDLFISFDAKPVASGSIAQVYRAKLRPEHVESIGIRNAKGELLDEVAVKIRHPGVLKETWIDLDIIYAIVDRVPGLCIPFNKEELKLMIQYQIDFRFEGHYLSRFRHNFREEIKQGYIAFPYVSQNSLRQAVLIESWANGQTVGEIFSEVGELFRPLVRKIDGPIIRTQKTLKEELTQHAQSIKTFVKSFTVGAIYVLADMCKVNIDSFNAKYNFDYPTTHPPSHLGQFLHSVLPARGRVGEVEYVDDPALTMEENLRAKQKKILAYTLFDMFAKMFLRDNLIHADLHAGNVLYDHKSFAHTATVLDAGMTVALEADIMSQFELFLRAICNGEPNSLVEACSRFEVNLPNAESLTILPPIPNSFQKDFAKLSIPNGSGVGLLATNSVVRNRFHHDITDIFHKFYGNSNIWGATMEADNVSIGDVVGQVLLTMQTHGVILRGDVAASIMAMSVIEGLLRQLDPELDIVLNCLPYFLRYKK